LPWLVGTGRPTNSRGSPSTSGSDSMRSSKVASRSSFEGATRTGAQRDGREIVATVVRQLDDVTSVDRGQGGFDRFVVDTGRDDGPTDGECVVKFGSAGLRIHP
jgi:hypothetical protein